MAASIKTTAELELMRQAGHKLAKIITQLSKQVKPGISANELNKIAENLVLSSGATPAFKNYQGFPASLCVSINEQIVHGLPGARILKSGDIVSLDLGLQDQGFFSDMAVTVPVGEVGFEAKRLLRVTKKALRLALRKIRAGNTLGDVGHTIQRYAEDQGVAIFKELCGHGIGEKLHEPPNVFNFGQREQGTVLKTGMTLAIEPMLGLGSDKIKKSPDGFSYVTNDGSLAAHFEHTVAVTADGCEVLTMAPNLTGP